MGIAVAPLCATTDPRAIMLRFNDIAGLNFGTEDFSQLLYALVRMHKPECVVELGTGLGVSALWMALAAKENGVGHVWTVDDFGLFDDRSKVVARVLHGLSEAGIATFEKATAETFYTTLSDVLGLSSYVTFVKARIELTQARHFDQYSFAGTPIDVLFSDFRHGGAEILALLGHFLPRMAPASSIFIHSASTAWTSYLLLEQLVSQLNSGRIPQALQEFCSTDLASVLKNRRIVLVHLTERKDRSQNSAAWLKIEPIDVFPYPRSQMRR
ncbi:class I SAM-dependent methyltransferase [Granulicella sp. dw_53]|uniref:class I SAM-dependent methyltransferase n=1 Tax=Granulicella sp. dw_53 TaxID=2719792 RepID=UPI001BD543FF|nr:class I SAM-dependent methyltransferase [Granulicella sp. dw_53]